MVRKDVQNTSKPAPAPDVGMTW